MVTGILIGRFLPAIPEFLGKLEYANVSIPVAVLIWLMIVPMLVRIDFGSLHRIATHARGIGVTLFVNWAVKPFSMALLGWIFIRHVFAAYLPADQLDARLTEWALMSAPEHFQQRVATMLGADARARMHQTHRVRSIEDLNRIAAPKL
mgnify:CR=1 FL=1